MKPRHSFSEYVFMAAVFFALAMTVGLALAPKVNFSREEAPFFSPEQSGKSP